MLISLSNCKKNNTNFTNGKTSALFNPDKTYGSLTDQDGNIYKTITIGSQTWMAENLRTTTYRNGDKIPNVTNPEIWYDLKAGAFCNYDNISSPDSIATFGRLYNWEAVVDQRNIAPIGWHVPTYEEWKQLESYLGDSVAGNKLKETGTLHWKTPNYNATNETGFTAKGSGYLMGYNVIYGYHHKKIEGGWWTVSEDSSNVDFAYHVTMGYNYSILGGCWCPKRDGFSVRCIKD
jgi:uncharacterized protein (TIGR02145 family)